MRSQTNQVQESGEQKKSVFDRLGRQLDARTVNRGSPMNYGEHQMHPMMHDQDYLRFARGDQHADMTWRYENDRRHITLARERHQPQIPGPYPPQFDMSALPGRQPPQYFSPPSHHHPQYHANPGAPPPPGPLMGPEVITMEMHQRRPSPKYDRHGNPIRGTMRMDHLSGMSPPENYMGPPPGPMLPLPGYDLPPMGPGMCQQNRWHESMHTDYTMHPRLLQDERFIDSHRFSQQPKALMMMNTEIPGNRSNFEASRYSKWRERRDVITNLDRQTAQSSSKTDSLKSSLQQTETKNQPRRGNNKDSRQSKNEQIAGKQASAKKEPTSSTSAAIKPKQDVSTKDEPTEISDGEIIDDEDSSDESDTQRVSQDKDRSDRITDNSNIRKSNYGRIVTQEQQYYDRKKRRRLADRDDYPMDYETISDEELDEFISDKKLVDEAKLEGTSGDKNSSEIELLNALGLDWANLIELSKQSKKEAPTSGSALRRFSIPSYLPTLGITRELAGPEIHNYIIGVCQ